LIDEINKMVGKRAIVEFDKSPKGELVIRLIEVETLKPMKEYFMEGDHGPNLEGLHIKTGKEMQPIKIPEMVLNMAKPLFGMVKGG